MAKHKFKAGESGNPGGRPKGTGVGPMLEAIKKYEKANKVKYWDIVIKKSISNPRLMTAVINKLAPNMHELTGEGGGPVLLKLEE